MLQPVGHFFPWSDISHLPRLIWFDASSIRYMYWIGFPYANGTQLHYMLHDTRVQMIMSGIQRFSIRAKRTSRASISDSHTRSDLSRDENIIYIAVQQSISRLGNNNEVAVWLHSV